MSKIYALVISLVFLILLSSEVRSEVVWASGLLDFSSQLSPNDGAARGVLGEPNVLPEYGFTPVAWMPRAVFGREAESVLVSFANPIFASQVAINENFFSGTIMSIILLDSLDNQYIAYENRDPKLNSTGNIFHATFEKTNFRVMKLLLKVKAELAYKGMQIDAIGISDEKELIDIQINNATDMSVKSIPENLGTGVNSPYHEINPLISQDGKTLYFTRENHPENIGDDKRQDVWVSHLDEHGNFSKAENIGFPINNQMHNYAISLLPDGNTMLLGNIYKPDGTMAKGISITHREGDGWTMPAPLNLNNEVTGKDVTYCLAANQKVMLTSCERADSYGKSDIYVMFLQNDSTWSEPLNLGKTINTGAADVAPYLASDMTTLYFSTDGRPGYGSADFYISRRLDDTWTNWSEPQNLGPKFNTPGWDAYFTLPASGDYAYYVSNNNSYGNEDVFRIKLPEILKPKIVVLVSGRVLNAKDNSPVAANIIYELLGKNENAGKATANPQTGEYRIALPAGKMYGFLAEADGYLSVSENLDLKNITYYQEVYRDLFLVPVKKGATITIQNIFFATNEHELLSESFPELDRLAKFMLNNTEYNLEVSGHTDDVGSNALNLRLSKSRAKSVADYLIMQGVGKKRISIKGYGKSRPIVPNNSDENRAKNRRVEFKLL